MYVTEKWIENFCSVRVACNSVVMVHNHRPKIAFTTYSFAEQPLAPDTIFVSRMHNEGADPKPKQGLLYFTS